MKARNETESMCANKREVIRIKSVEDRLRPCINLIDITVCHVDDMDMKHKVTVMQNIALESVH